MRNGRITQRRKYNTFTSPSSSLFAPIRPFTSSSAHSFSSFSPKDLQTGSEHPKGFSHSLERMTIHRPETEAVPKNGAEHVATAETTNPSPVQLVSDTEAVAEQDQPTQTAHGVASPAASSASALQRMAVSAGDPVPPPPRVNRQGGTKHSGWSLERMAITREQLAPAQRYATGVSEASEPAPQPEVLQKKNTTGLPDHLKAGVESLSGLSLDDVHVHYNSPKPAGVDALAYTQGTDIHVGMGQEKHLAHEAWHVVQQKQRRVQPTLQAKGVAINDDTGLEREADVMGMKASNLTSGQVLPMSPTKKGGITSNGSIQRMIGFEYQLTRSSVTPNTDLHKGDAIGDRQNGIVPTIDIGQAGEYNLEVISDVFDEVDVRGWANFKNAVSATCDMVRRLEAATSNAERPVSEVLTGGIDGYDIQVPDQVGTLHITAGIQLDRLQKFLTDFSNKNNVLSPNPNGPLAMIVPDAVNRGTPVLTQIETQQGVHFSDPLKREIFSLVSLLATTMQRLEGGAPYFKGLYRLLNRTDMATQVEYVRTRMDAELAGGGQPVPTPHPLLTVIEASLPDAPYLDQLLVPRKPDGVTNLTWFGSLLSPLSGTPLTRRAWLVQLFNGNDPLSVAWLNQQAGAGAVGAQDAADILESVGSLGDRTDPSTSSIRPIFEIRNIPRLPSVNDLEEWALGVSRFIKAINEGRDQPLVLEGRRGNDITRFFSQLFHR